MSHNNSEEKFLLDIGGMAKSIEIPPHYAGFTRHILDPHPREGEKIEYVTTIEEMGELPIKYDAIYASHVMEHIYITDVLPAFRKFWNTLKVGGIIEVRSPDFKAACEVYMKTGNMFAPLYTSAMGIIVTAQDVFYGHQYDLQKGHDAMAHKCGFDLDLLGYIMGKAGFVEMQSWESPSSFELRVTGWKGFANHDMLTPVEVPIEAANDPI